MARGRRHRPARGTPLTRDGRYLVASSFVASLGYGMYGIGSLMFFTRVSGLSVSQVGIGLSIAGATALALSIPIGRLADRMGARPLCIAIGIGQAVLLAMSVSIRSFLPFVLLISVLGVLEHGGSIARGALIADVAPPEDRVRISAFVRSAFNLGLPVGIAVTGPAILVDSTAGYSLIMLGNAATAAVAVLLTAGVRPTRPADRDCRSRRGPARARRRKALHDLPYLAVALLGGVVTVADIVLSVGVPLWLVTYTSAPRTLASWLLIMSTILIVLTQVPASRDVAGPGRAMRRLRLSTLLSSAACVLLATSYGLGSTPAIVLLTAAVILLSAGQVWSSVALWSFRYGFAREDAQGEYGGVFSMATGLRSLIGPAVITALMASLTAAGWVVLAVAFAGLSLAVAPIVAWCERTRVPTVDGPSPPPGVPAPEARTRTR